MSLPVGHDRPMHQLFGFLQRYRAAFVRACSASITNKVLDLMPPLLVAWVIDTVRREPPAWIVALLPNQGPWTIAIFLSALGVLIFGFESLFEWAYKSGFMRLAQRVQHDLRVEAYDQVQQREIRFFENMRMGETLAMLNDDVNQLERFLNSVFNEVLQLAVLFLFAGGVLFGTSWQLALIGLIPVPLILWGSVHYQRKIRPRYTRIRQAVGALTSRLENNIAGILVIKSFTAEDLESQRVRNASNEYQEANFAAIRLSAIYVPLIRMAVAIGFGGVLLLGSYWVLNDSGILTVGELVLFSMMIQRLLWPMTRLGSMMDEWERARASAARTFSLLKQESDIQDPAMPQSLGRARGNIECRDVWFGYQADRPILAGMNFQMNAGETIGIAGTTGAGKSTLLKLLLRLYDPNRGQVLLDGHPLTECAQADIRHNIALVSQDVYLFHGTIAENIAYSQQDAPREAIQRAAKLAQLHDFVADLQDGYDTLVGERGIKLSGGQRQRLSIARAILKNAPIMIFDEATSSVDTETERAIQENLMRLTEGRTAIIIAHRLSTIRSADRILVLGEGRVLDQGTHETLLSRTGIYRDLWSIQSGTAPTIQSLQTPRPSGEAVQ